MIKSVAKAMDILHVFSSLEPRLSLAEISRRLDLPKSTTHNLLNTLTHSGFIERIGSDQYALGTAIITLSQSVRVNAELRDRAAPMIRELADSTGETVYLTSYENDQVLYIYAVETSSRLMARTAVGERSPLHCTAVGKAILASLPPERVEAITAELNMGLPRFTEHTISTLDKLRVELEETRKMGYALDRQEHEIGTFCIGARIQNAEGRTIGACSISGRDPEIIAWRREDLAAMLLHTAQETSRQMGYLPIRHSQLIQGSIGRGQTSTMFSKQAVR